MITIWDYKGVTNETHFYNLIAFHYNTTGKLPAQYIVSFETTVH